MTELTNSHNEVVKTLEGYQQSNVAEKANESHYMMATLIELLVEKGVFTADDVKRCAERVQLSDLGWTPKPEPAIAETGDIIRFKFQIFDGDKMVEDQQEPFAYTLGSKGLTCDADLVGIKAGEQRTLKTIFGPGFKIKDVIGKEVTMVVLCTGVMVTKT